jgi:hypothetical protein
MRRILSVTGVVLLGVALLATTGCVRVELEEGGYKTNSAEVLAEGATEVDAQIDMAAGELFVRGNADELMNAEFEYSHTSWLPKVEYDVSDGTGDLRVKTPDTVKTFPAGNTRYSWDIQLGNELPLNLDVNMGAGEANLDLRGLDLRDLKLDLGAGETTIDLSGDWKNDLTGDITCGAGELTLKVPANVGVRIVGYRDGLGTYSADGFAQDGDALVNDAWDTATVKFEIELRRGLGDVTVETVE